MKQENMIKIYDQATILLNECQYYTLQYMKTKIEQFNYQLLKNNFEIAVCEKLEMSETIQELEKNLTQIKKFILNKILKKQ